MTASSIHDFGKVEMLGLIDSVTGYIHHAIGQGCANENTDPGYEKNGFEQAALAPTAEFRKLTASLLTPTMRSNTASTNRK